LIEVDRVDRVDIGNEQRLEVDELNYGSEVVFSPPPIGGGRGEAR
jgi:hypothetical protein